MKRIIEIESDGIDSFNNFKEETNGELVKAIGYLSTWNMSAYSHVKIYHDVKEKELIARYSLGGDHIVGYVIGAIWHDKEKRFSFHS